MDKATKKQIGIIAAVLVAVLALLQSRFSESTKTFEVSSPAKAKVLYSQDVNINKELIPLIENADRFAFFAVYTFTRTDIRDALIAAKKRGIEVRGITDRSQFENLATQRSLIKALREAGIDVVTQDHLGIMHLKLLVTDKAYASGSYNWTSSATNLNDEIIEIGNEETLRSAYERIFLELWEKYAK